MRAKGKTSSKEKSGEEEEEAWAPEGETNDGKGEEERGEGD